MFFDLTDSLRDAICKALENQDKKFLVDAVRCALVEESDSVFDDEENFYALPEWTSADGFSLMEEFTGGLHSPLAYTELQDVLHSGKGVFRGFKDVLKLYPLVERRWHFFKARALLNYVNNWYNSLRESWGLEKLDSEPEETDCLICDDFDFAEFNFDEDEDSVLKILDEAAAELAGKCSDGIFSSIKEVWLRQASYNRDEQQGLVCKSISGEFAGAAFWAPCPGEQKKTALFCGLFVEKKFRGLGIARTLFERTVDSLTERGFNFILIASTFIPESMQGMLNRSGFKKIGSVWIAELPA